MREQEREIGLYTYQYNISEYFGVTQDPVTKELIIIMPYYDSGDLIHYITKDFHNVSWKRKLEDLKGIMNGLYSLHSVNIVHRDFHSGNIFFDGSKAIIGDLGISKSATST